MRQIPTFLTERILKRLVYFEKIGYMLWCQPSVNDENTDPSTTYHGHKDARVEDSKVSGVYVLIIIHSFIDEICSRATPTLNTTPVASYK